MAWQRGYREDDQQQLVQRPASSVQRPASLDRCPRGHGLTNVEALSPRPATRVKPLASQLSFENQSCGDEEIANHASPPSHTRKGLPARWLALATPRQALASRRLDGRRHSHEERNDAALPTQSRPIQLACRALSASGAAVYYHHRAVRDITTLVYTYPPAAV